MADYTAWQEVTVTQVCCLDAPSNGTELSKMLAGAYRKFSDVHGREPYDDEVTVTTRDGGSRDGGQVVVSFTLRAEKGSA